ncbi:GMC family oxidoreductase N-terminal domain-containing protein [Rhodopirellula sp. JC639]|uniref:GMC family oxidoreductase N-terminal domain-containing protein n=1 Tax=Stieleria mannarensis TaxID=2755585 RepID=UPI0015FFE6A3|nr:GMC family oxidoreductase N-terminal domain-containing protein [Rhodopirellula sp. JC639]
MDDLSSLDNLSILGTRPFAREIDRRQFGKGAVAAGLLPLGLFGWADKPTRECPMQTIREKRFETLVAIMAAQIDSLWCGRRGDNACQVANDVLRYADHLPYRMQLGMSVALLWLDVYSVKHTAKRLKHHSREGVRRLLNQGETPRRAGAPPLIQWDDDHLLHMAVSGLAMLGRLVIHSRAPARELIGLGWSKKCEQVSSLVSLPAPPLADLNHHYDVVIIGSGAGGATAATRLTAQGRKVLILDCGDFVSPDALVQRIEDSDGSVRLAPPRSDEVLMRLYKDAGGQISGGLGNVDSKLDLVLPQRRKKIPPRQTINVCQAKVFGGGPYVNNAIHLPISREVYDTKWAGRQPTGLGYDQLAALMDGINAELGVNTTVTETQISDRSMRFAEGCQTLGEDVQPLPVAMRLHCSGCGSDNSVDSFGDHIGGLHPYSPTGANSFLVQAMHNPEPARVSYRTEAKRLRVESDAAGKPIVSGVDVTRVEDDGCHTQATITADQYVVAAGIGPTTKLVAQGLKSGGYRNRHLGKRFTANVGTAVYAMFDKPIWPSGSDRPEPGVTQCFLVDRRMVEKDGRMVEEPALENWFHFPGTVALALTGWFKEFACTMRRFNHLSMAGIVVPTQVRPCNAIDDCGNVNISLDCDEFEILLLGIRRIARIYFAAAKPDDGVTLHLPTKAMLLRGGRPLRIRDMDDLEWAIGQIRRRGPAFVNLLTTHGQGGASIGDVVDPTTFQVKTDCGQHVSNLTVADASLFPAGCEINPQLTLKALATIAAEQVVQRTA